MRIKLGLNTQTIIGFLCAFFAVIASFSSINMPVYLLYIGLVILWTALIFFEFLYTGILQKEKKYFLLALIMMVLLLFRSAWKTYEIILYIGCLMLCLYSARKGKWISIALRIMEKAYIFYALATIVLYFTPDFYLNHVVTLFPNSAYRLVRWYKSGYMSGLTNHYSTNAMLLAVGLMLSGAKLLTYLQGTDKKQRKKYIILTLLMMVSLLLTAKRAHIIFSIAALFIVYYNSTANRNIAVRVLKLIGVVIGLAVIGTIVLNIVPALSGFLLRFQETMGEGDITKGRNILWKLAINAFKDHFLLGIGWGQFSETLSWAYDGVTSYDVHNIYLQLLCETGIVGFASYIFWMVAFLRRTLKLFAAYVISSTKTRDKSVATLLTFALGFQCFFLIYGFTGNPLYDEEMYIPYFICCAIVLYYSNHFKEVNHEQ